jgi:hypothetical protein
LIKKTCKIKKIKIKGMRIKLDKKNSKMMKLEKKKYIYILKMIPNKINSNYKNDD